MVDPNVFGFVSGQRLRPRADPGLRVRNGDRADRDAEARRPRPAQVLRERRPSAGAVPMRVPTLWLREHCDPDLTARRAGRAPGAADHRGRADLLPGAALRPRASWSERSLSVEQHPDADRLTVCEVETGDATRTIVCGAPNVAPGQTVPVALPGAVMPGGREARSRRAARRHLGRDDPLGGGASARRRRGRDLRRSSATTPRADGCARYSARRGPADRRAGLRARGQLEPRGLPRRLRGGAGGARVQRRSLAEAPWEQDAEATGEGEAVGLRVGRPSRFRSSVRASPPGCSPR